MKVKDQEWYKCPVCGNKTVLHNKQFSTAFYDRCMTKGCLYGIRDFSKGKLRDLE